VWLLLFSMLFILGLLGLWKLGTSRYLWCAGMGLAGMILTKETYIIHLACALIALPLLALSIGLIDQIGVSIDSFIKFLPSDKLTWLKRILARVRDTLTFPPVDGSQPAQQQWNWLDLLVVSSVAAAAIVLFYSGTFFHWSGVKGLYKTFDTWFKTGSNGNGHEKKWWYWLMLIGRYEAAVAIGLLACALCQWFKDITVRYLAIYAVGVLLAYSIVHYKTPWCIISVVWPFLFLFAAVLILVPVRWLRLAHGAIAVVLAASLTQTVILNYFRCTTDTEPYVYVQTYNDIFKLTRPLLQLAKKDPVFYQLTGHLIRTSSYPLPWILGDFTRVGYYEHDNPPAKMDADFLLVQEDRVAETEPKLRNAYYADSLTIRPYQDTSKLYLSARVFSQFFPGRTPEFPAKQVP
ncbi:MAG: hypothetical protein H0U99_07120, partial [Chthoniobacterales bacterium]|nr:hypothetical protein [Chthoniobacterales bacterium]